MAHQTITPSVRAQCRLGHFSRDVLARDREELKADLIDLALLGWSTAIRAVRSVRTSGAVRSVRSVRGSVRCAVGLVLLRLAHHLEDLFAELRDARAHLLILRRIEPHRQR